MFIIGLTIFILYMVGYIIMVKKANELQGGKSNNDSKLNAPNKKAS